MVNLYFHQRRIARDASQIDIIRRAEVAEAIRDKTSLVHLDGTSDVRPMAIDDICSVINAEVCQLAQRTAIFSEESLTALRQVVAGSSFGSAVE